MREAAVRAHREWKQRVDSEQPSSLALQTTTAVYTLEGPCSLGRSSSHPPSVLGSAWFSGRLPTSGRLALPSGSLSAVASHRASSYFCAPTSITISCPLFSRRMGSSRVRQAEGPTPTELPESPAPCHILYPEYLSQFPQLLYRGY